MERGLAKDCRRPSRNLVMGVLATVGIAVAVVLFIINLRPSRPARNLATDHALGVTLAEEAHRLLPDGGQVLVIAPQPASVAMDSRLNALQETLKANNPAAVLVVERLDADQLKPSMEGLLPPEPFGEVLRDHTEARLVISLVGCPDLEALRLGYRKLPPFVSVADRGPGVQRLLTGRLLAVAIVPKKELAPLPAQTMAGSRAWLETTHDIVTAGNAHLLDP